MAHLIAAVAESQLRRPSTGRYAIFPQLRHHVPRTATCTQCPCHRPRKRAREAPECVLGRSNGPGGATAAPLSRWPPVPGPTFRARGARGDSVRRKYCRRPLTAPESQAPRGQVAIPRVKHRPDHQSASRGPPLPRDRVRREELSPAMRSRRPWMPAVTSPARRLW